MNFNFLQEFLSTEHTKKKKKFRSFTSLDFIFQVNLFLTQHIRQPNQTAATVVPAWKTRLAFGIEQLTGESDRVVCPWPFWRDFTL